MFLYAQQFDEAGSLNILFGDRIGAIYMISCLLLLDCHELLIDIIFNFS